jgi:hypothetical protein
MIGNSITGLNPMQLHKESVMKKFGGMQVLLVLILLLALDISVKADDVEEAVKEGLQYYHDGDFSNAAGNLEYAAQLIRQKKGGELESLLPQPLAGWTAEETESQAMGAAMFGGGVTAERRYRKGESEVSVQIVTDSPLLQGVLMMFTNPMFAASDGGKLEKIKGQKALVKYDASARQGDIQIVVGGKYLVSIEGSEVEKADLQAYAEAVSYETLE